MKRILPILLVFLFNSCFDQNDCIDTSSNLVKIDLATRAGVSKIITFSDVLRDSIGDDFAGSLHYKFFEKRDLSSLQLPVDPTQKQTSYSFITSDSRVFHLRLEYSTFSRVIATDCGAFLYYKDLKVVNTSFDSTHVISPQLFKSATTNIKLLF